MQGENSLIASEKFYRGEFMLANESGVSSFSRKKKSPLKSFGNSPSFTPPKNPSIMDLDNVIENEQYANVEPKRFINTVLKNCGVVRNKNTKIL